jgi:hypothetical protein
MLFTAYGNIQKETDTQIEKKITMTSRGFIIVVTNNYLNDRK